MPLKNTTKEMRNFSEMDEIIQFATKTETIGDHGFPQTGIVASGTNVWARVRYLNTDEKELGTDQEKFSIEIEIQVRYDSANTEFKWVYWNEKYYDIFAIEKTSRNWFQIIKARLIET